MIIRSRQFTLFLSILLSCNNELVDDPIPPAIFTDIIIDVNFPEYASLRLDGGHKEISGGVRGIIVYRTNATSYQAYEKNCSFHPNEACATVNVHTSGLFMTDPCCSSNFSFTDGSPTGGQAWRPLRRYRTQVNGTRVTITDESIE